MVSPNNFVSSLVELFWVWIVLANCGTLVCERTRSHYLHKTERVSPMLDIVGAQIMSSAEVNKKYIKKLNGI